MTALPAEILSLLDLHHNNAQPCAGCNSNCCFESGFAVEDNVRLIYNIYQAGHLRRQDYTFIPDLSYEDFLSIYFDIIVATPADPLLYFPRHLTRDGLVLRVLPAAGTSNYWAFRSTILKAPINESCGCVFLDKKLVRGSFPSLNRCVLHHEDSDLVLGPKPIDCIFLTCDSGRIVRKATPEIEDKWFGLLRKYFHRVGQGSPENEGIAID